MANYALVDIATGYIKTSNSSPDDGVFPKVNDPETEQLVEISDSEFEEIFNKEKTYCNIFTAELEITNIYKFVGEIPASIPVGKTNIVFYQKTFDNLPIISPVTLEITVRDITEIVEVTTGSFELELDCPDEMVFSIKITGNRHETLEQEVIVSG